MKLYLTCPGCQERLPQIGNEPLLPGDSVTCGMCDQVWIPIPKRPLTMTERLRRQGRIFNHAGNTSTKETK